MTRWQGAGLIVGFGGALLIFSPWHSAAGVASAGGLECLAASVSYAVSYVYMDKFLARRGLNPIVLSACQLLVAALLLAVALPFSGAGLPHASAAPGLRADQQGNGSGIRAAGPGRLVSLPYL